MSRLRLFILASFTMSLFGQTPESPESSTTPSSTIVPSVVRTLRPETTDVVAGTNGKIDFSATSPFTVTGVLLESFGSTGWIVAKGATSSNDSGFMVYNSNLNPIFVARSDGLVSIGSQPAAGTPFFIAKDGPTLYGSARYNARIAPTSADRGVLLGYDTNMVGGVIASSGSQSSLVFATAGTDFSEKMRIDPAGRVGIGGTPSEKLDLFGGTAQFRGSGAAIKLLGLAGSPSYIHFDQRAQPGGKLWRLGSAGAGPIATSFDLFNETDSQVVWTANSLGNVGIGTELPLTRLHTKSLADVEHRIETASAAGFANIRLLAPANATNGSGQLSILFQEGIGNYTPDNRFWLLGYNPSAEYFQLFGGDQPVNRLVVTNSGAVVIGGTQPQENAKLHVEGNIHVTGNINAKYQDIAEWVPSATDLTPGTVVVLDASAPNTVRASTHAYDEAVAGVISPQPGLVLGEKGDSKEMVATTGRVRVRVDARRTPIRIGDLLVSSGDEGVAMASKPVVINGIRMHRPGTIIGKALEPLPSGTGEILVLLSLQ